MFIWDIQQTGPHEWFSAAENDERDAKFFCFSYGRLEPFIAYVTVGFLAKSLMVTSFAVEIAFACNAENKNRRNVKTLFFPILSDLGGTSLPIQCSYEEHGLRRVSHGGSKRFLEEDS
jgi:hypothetical protein